MENENENKIQNNSSEDSVQNPQQTEEERLKKVNISNKKLNRSAMTILGGRYFRDDKTGNIFEVR